MKRVITKGITILLILAMVLLPTTGVVQSRVPAVPPGDPVFPPRDSGFTVFIDGRPISPDMPEFPDMSEFPDMPIPPQRGFPTVTGDITLSHQTLHLEIGQRVVFASCAVTDTFPGYEVVRVTLPPHTSGMFWIEPQNPGVIRLETPQVFGNRWSMGAGDKIVALAANSGTTTLTIRVSATISTTITVTVSASADSIVAFYGAQEISLIVGDARSVAPRPPRQEDAPFSSAFDDAGIIIITLYPYRMWAPFTLISSDPGVVYVHGSSLIVAHAVGTVTLTATFAHLPGLSASLTVQVVAPAILPGYAAYDGRFRDQTLTLGERSFVQAAYRGSGVLTATSSSPEIAALRAGDLLGGYSWCHIERREVWGYALHTWDIEGLSAGTATIIIESESGQTASFDVTVQPWYLVGFPHPWTDIWAWPMSQRRATREQMMRTPLGFWQRYRDWPRIFPHFSLENLEEQGYIGDDGFITLSFIHRVYAYFTDARMPYLQYYSNAYSGVLQFNQFAAGWQEQLSVETNTYPNRLVIRYSGHFGAGVESYIAALRRLGFQETVRYFGLRELTRGTPGTAAFRRVIIDFAGYYSDRPYTIITAIRRTYDGS